MGKCDEANVEMSMGDSASPLKQDIFSFTVPPEAPVFTPTAEEFQDPLAYINKIRPIAEKCGICKIKPPKNWQPPFAVDVDRLRFTPRIQRLNELEAITRVKLNFLDQIAKFWELQGSHLKIPTVERKPLDLYSLHKIVHEAGGFDLCTAERKWSKIAVRMGHPQAKGVGTILKNHYERILFPYDVFKSGEAIDVKPPLEVKGEMTPEKANTQGGCKRGGSAQKGSPNAPGSDSKPIPTRRWRKLNELDEQEGTQTEGCLGSGETPGSDRKKDLRSKNTPNKQDSTTILDDKKTPVKESPNKRRSAQHPISMASCPHSVPSSRPVRSAAVRSLQAQRQDSMTVNVVPAQPDSADPLAKYICHNCGRGDVEEQMLLCDGCDDSYHTFCLMPPLESIPKGDWRCPPCIAQEVSKPTEAFGFEQAQREYTLQQFGEMADQFKSEYFNMPVHMVPTQTVEKEFWRIVSSIDEDVTVEYGADLHSMDHGSGFPTKASKHLYPGDQEYADSSWNLNNLPLLEGSVLGHINADISGMKVPWMYVGMCFATFCWHNEDHWSYSINYMHWGEPKTWYGVPGSKAETFETTMRSAAPELFHWQPDLLHQLVTIMNPNILMQAGVPVYRTDQNAGEFVITFPRAYHAGFNQGYNFAEAVNFTPADWLKIGRDCIDHYSNLRRFCVFSHDELVCKMALEADKLEATVALATYQDMRAMLSQERKLRKSLLDWGVTEAEREAFELLPDDERQCMYCKTTCFLSAVTCPCTEHLVCLRHYTELQHNNQRKCAPAKHKLRYRFTLDELPSMLEKLKRRSEAVKEWADAVSNALDPNTPKTCDLEGLRAHLKKGQELKMHKADIVRALATAIEGAEKCASVIHQLDLNKMRTRTRHSADLKYKLTVEELTLFCEEIDGLACVLPEGSAVKEVLRQTIELEKMAESLLVGEPGSTPEKIRDMEQCVERGSALCIQLPKLTLISNRLQQEKFLDEVKMHREEYDTLNIETINKLLEQGLKIQPHFVLETQLAALQKLKVQVEKWEERAKTVLSPTGDHQALEEIESLLKSADKIEAYLPTRQQLNTAVNNAKDWLKKVEEMQSKESYPYFSTLEGVVKRGQCISISLYEKDMLGEALDSARVWKEKTSRTFLKKGWLLSLMEALSPRTDVLTGAKRCVVQPPPPPPTPQTGRGRHHHNTSAADRSATNAANNNNLNSSTSGGNAPGTGGSGGRAWSPAPSTPEAEQFMRCFSEERTPTQIVAAFKAAEDREMANMRELRSRNLRKDIRLPSQGVSYCYCLKRQYGVMTQCDLCKEWYHTSCVNSLPLNEAEAPPGRFLCPGCVRTRRPRLEVILGLLVALQKLPVRLAEGEALQCLTERAMAWQDGARALLASKEAAKGLATIAQAENAQAAGREKSDKMLGGDMQRSGGNKNARSGTMSPTHDSIHNRNSSASEHAYSASPPANVGSSQGGGGAASATTRTVRLSPGMMHKLEDLMMEGDLLEVTMAETQQMWGLLKAARDHTSVWSERGALGALTDISGNNGSLNESRESPTKRVSSGTHQQQLKRARRTKEQHMMMMLQQGGTPGTPGGANTSNNANMNKTLSAKKMRKSPPAAPRRASAPAPTATNYLNRKQQSVTAGGGLMMKKHFLAKQERRRRGMTTKQSTRGRRAGVHTKMKRGGGAGIDTGGPGRLMISTPGNSHHNSAAGGGLLARSASPQSDDDSSHASSNEDDEDCAAFTCLRPTGKEVDWVQCDGGCEKWFHLHCVGLSKNSLKDDEDYYCSICSNGASGKKANKPRDTGHDVAKTRGNERVKEERTTKNSTKQTATKTETKRERLSLEAKRLAAAEALLAASNNTVESSVKKSTTSDNLMCEEKMERDEEISEADVKPKVEELKTEVGGDGDVTKMEVDDTVSSTTVTPQVKDSAPVSSDTVTDSVDMKDN